MKFSLIVTGSIALILAAALIQGARMIARERIEAATLREQSLQLEKRLEEERLAATKSADDLAAARAQLAEIPDPASAATTQAEREHQTEIAAWLGRTRRLRQYFEDHPEEKIPEMRQLKDDSWLRVTRNLDLDNEEQLVNALASIRNSAKLRMVPLIDEAIAKFKKAAGPAAVPTIADLAAQLKNPDDADVLARYDVAPDPREPGKWMLQEKSPVDVYRDSRYTFYGGNGVGTRAGVPAWLPGVQERFDQAHANYSAAHQGASAMFVDMEKLLPYFDPPLEPAIAEKLVKPRPKNP